MPQRKNGNEITSLNGISRQSDYIKRLSRARGIINLVMLFSVIVFGLILVFAILNDGISNMVKAFESVNLLYYGAAFLVLFSGYLIRFPKWELYIRRLKIRMDRRKNFVIYLSMYSMDITPGRWGRAIVSYTINRLKRVRFSRTFPAVVADIFTDFLGFLIVCLVAAFFIDKYVLVSLIIGFLLLLPFVFMYTKGPFEYFKRKLSRIERMRSFFEVGELYFHDKKRLGKDVYLYSLIFTVPAVLLNSAALYLVIYSFGIHIGIVLFPTVVFIYTSSLLLGMITGIPATLGVTDAALVGYLTLFLAPLGITFALASAITILFRIISVWFVEGFGIVALIQSKKYWRL